MDNSEFTARKQQMAIVDARDICIDVMGRLAEFWGFTRTMGRVYGCLYSSYKPMTQQQMIEALGVSAANVSMSLKTLLLWGAVHKIDEKGSRKLHYVAEAELRRVVQNILGGREQRELQEALRAFKEAKEIVQDMPVSENSEKNAEGVFLKGRVEHLESAARLSNRMLFLLLGEGKLDIEDTLNSTNHKRLKH